MLSVKEKEAIKSGSLQVLKKHLEVTRDGLVEKLLRQKDDVRFVQGEAYIVTELLKLL